MPESQNREKLPILGRGIDHFSILSGKSSQCLFFEKIQRYHALSQAIGKTPLDDSSKSWLLEHFSKEWYFAIYHFKKPIIIVFNWGRGDQRFFLVTNEGFIIEPDFFSHWDTCFKFIEADSVSGSLLLNLSTAKDHSLSAESLIWSPFSSNYTHFLIDSLGPVLGVSEELPSFLNKRFFLMLPYAASISPWQEEWMGLLRSFRRINADCLDDMSLNVFRPLEVMMPVASNAAVSLHYLTSRLGSFRMSSMTLEHISKPNCRLILLTRTDYRRARIRNIDALEEFILSSGGNVVDISRLSIKERLRLFDSTCICIAESSGCINFAIYSSQLSRLVALVDGDSLKDKSFVLGGWRYAVGYMHRSLYVVGIDSEPLPGSPLGSSYYPLEAIAGAIDDSRRLIFPGH